MRVSSIFSLNAVMVLFPQYNILLRTNSSWLASLWWKDNQFEILFLHRYICIIDHVVIRICLYVKYMHERMWSCLFEIKIVNLMWSALSWYGILVMPAICFCCILRSAICSCSNACTECKYSYLPCCGSSSTLWLVFSAKLLDTYSLL